MGKGKQVDCTFCDNVRLSKEIIGLNKKLIHRQIERLMCMSCLAEYFEISEEELNDMVERFKLQGCTLFG